MRRDGWLLLVLAGVVLAACGGGNGKDGAVAPPTTAGAVPAARPVGVRVETFVDPSRQTAAHGPVAAKPSRTLRTNVLFPSTVDGGPPDTSAGPYPLVVFAHGSGGFGTGYLPMLRSWAAAGYVVAAPEFPIGVDNVVGQIGDGPSIEDLPNLPGDMSFVTTELLRLNADPASPLHGMVDPARIGAAGHSLGGMTTLAYAANTCCYDQRIKAAVVLAGREVPFGSGVFFARIRTPILFVHGDADNNVAYRDGQKAYADAPPPRFFLTLTGGDHSVMFDPFDAPAARAANKATVDFLDVYLKGNYGELARLRADAQVAGVTKLESET